MLPQNQSSREQLEFPWLCIAIKKLKLVPCSHVRIHGIRSEAKLTASTNFTLKAENCVHKGLDEATQTQEVGKETPFFKPLNVSKQSTSVFGLDNHKITVLHSPTWHAMSGTGWSQYL